LREVQLLFPGWLKPVAESARSDFLQMSRTTTLALGGREAGEEAGDLLGGGDSHAGVPY
jgi:hypothetical protein